MSGSTHNRAGRGLPGGPLRGRASARLIAPALALLAASAQLFATTLPYKGFNDLIAEADGIVVGTVSGIESHRSPNNDIYTFVTLNQLDVLAGSYFNSAITLRLKGGKIDNEVLDVAGSPNFAVNDRVVLFIHGNGKYMVPLVGWTQGMFRIVRDQNGQQIVTDHEGNRVIAIRGTQVVKDQRIQPEANIIGGPLGQRNANAGNPDHGTTGPVAEQRPSSEPSLASNAFVDAVRKAAAGRAGRGRLNSVAARDFSGISNRAESLAGTAAPAGADARPQAPVLPKRSPTPEVKDQQ